MDQDWEEKHKEHDKKKIKRIEKCNGKSTRNLIVGFIILLMAGDIAKDVLESISKHAFEPAVLVSAVIVFFAACLFFFRAMTKWEEAEDLTRSRYNWIPFEDEIEYIDQRFDNDLVKTLVRNISADNTQLVEVGYKAVKIHSADGKKSLYFNKCGYDQLSNYGTKQLAYYLGTHCFPDGFTIYQNKMVPAGANRYIEGVTDIGGEQPPKRSRLKRFNTMFNWLFVQLQQLLRLKTGVKLEQEDFGPSQINDGQILINKGYTPRSEGMKVL